jgi:hypothetical protein
MLDVEPALTGTGTSKKNRMWESQCRREVQTTFVRHQHSTIEDNPIIVHLLRISPLC